MSTLVPTPESDALRDRIVALCLELPEATASDGQHVKFEVRGKSFAYYTFDHHGDGRIAIACKAAPGVMATLADARPDRYFIPAYLGSKGWAGMDLTDGAAGWDEIGNLLIDAYRLAAPKRLVALVPA